MASDDVVKQIRKATRKKYTAEDKIRIVLEGLRGEIPVTEICRREGIAPTVYDGRRRLQRGPGRRVRSRGSL